MTLRSAARFGATLAGAAFLVTAISGDAQAKKDKKKKEKAPKEKAAVEIQETGISAFDDVFMKGKEMDDKIKESRDALTAANTALTTALGVTDGTPVGDALGGLKGQVKVEMGDLAKGEAPKITVNPDAPDNVKAAQEALTALGDALGLTVKNCASIPNDVKGLIDAAKGFPAAAPASIQEAIKSGDLPPTAVMKVPKIVGGNVKALGAIPGSADALVKEATATGDILKGLGQ